MPSQMAGHGARLAGCLSALQVDGGTGDAPPPPSVTRAWSKVACWEGEGGTCERSGTPTSMIDQ
jgi:hypothetical protein